MNILLLSHEWLVLALGLACCWLISGCRRSAKRDLGYVAAVGRGGHFRLQPRWPSAGARRGPQYAFGKMYALDGLALFFKRFFLLAASSCC